MTTCDVAITGTSCMIGSERTLGAWLGKAREREDCQEKIDLVGVDKEIDEIISEEAFPLHRSEKILIFCLKKALKDAKAEFLVKDSCRSSILLGNAYSNEEFKADNFKSFYKKELPKIFLIPYSSTNFLTAKLSIFYNIKGPSVTFSSGATSASEAILMASDLLVLNKADCVIVGGVSFFCEQLRDAFLASGFQQEACAFVVLERKEDALTRGAKIHGIINNLEHGFFSGLKNLDRYHIINNFVNHQKNFEEKGVIINRGRSFLKEFSNNDQNNGCKTLEKEILFLEEIFGNTFSSSGVIGIILACLLLQAKEQTSDDGSFFAKYKKLKELLFINQDSYGSYVSMILKRQDERKNK